MKSLKRNWFAAAALALAIGASGTAYAQDNQREGLHNPTDSPEVAAGWDRNQQEHRDHERDRQNQASSSGTVRGAGNNGDPPPAAQNPVLREGAAWMATRPVRPR